MIVLLSHLLLTVVTVSHATTGCNAYGWDPKHNDVTGCDLYYGAIAWMYEQGIAEGEFHSILPYGAESRFFHPERPINRAEFTKLVLLASGHEPTPCEADPFPDVSKDTWFAPFVCAAKDKGIIGGFPDGNFKPALHINFANGSKILTKAFGVDIQESDSYFSSEETIWYRKYTKALLREQATAPTIASFSQKILRGEMAEMLFRLSEKRPSYTMPNEENDNSPVGMGYHPYVTEFGIGLWSQHPEPPYAFAPAVTNLWGTVSPITGYRFLHTLQHEQCGESGLWEHCKPLLTDWSIGLFVTDQSLTEAYKKLLIAGEIDVMNFGEKQGQCSTFGVEGEYAKFCFAPINEHKTLVVEMQYIDGSHTYLDIPDITPIDTIHAYFDTVRENMQFVE